MGNKKDDIKREFQDLIMSGAEILNAESEKCQTENNSTKSNKVPTIMAYNAWYSKALPLVRQIVPERYKEFQELYIVEHIDINNITYLNYTIRDYLLRLQITRGNKDVVNPWHAFESKLRLQISILLGANERIDSILNDIKGVLQAELFDDDLDAADHLMKNGHFRASGALIGVLIERHLGQVAENHQIKLSKTNPTIADFNQEFKNEGILDIPNWRFLQRLSDLRNLCVHKKERDPTKDEVEELIEGTRKIMKILF